MNRCLRSSRGFTLIEIMVVIVILALIAALVAPKLLHRADDAKVDTTRTQIVQLETALKLYRLDNGVYPSTEQGLKSLVEKPATGQIPKNYKPEGYLESRKVPQDPWKNDYIYLSPGEHGDYEICSYGADGVKGGEGYGADICTWNMK